MDGHLHQLFIPVQLLEQCAGRLQLGGGSFGQHGPQPRHRLRKIARAQQIVKAAIRGGEVEQGALRQIGGIEPADVGFDGVAIRQQGEGGI